MRVYLHSTLWIVYVVTCIPTFTLHRISLERFLRPNSFRSGDAILIGHRFVGKLTSRNILNVRMAVGSKQILLVLRKGSKPGPFLFIFIFVTTQRTANKVQKCDNKCKSWDDVLGIRTWDRRLYMQANPLSYFTIPTPTLMKFCF